jgi:hypothetical protein
LFFSFFLKKKKQKFKAGKLPPHKQHGTVPSQGVPAASELEVVIKSGTGCCFGKMHL